MERPKFDCLITANLQKIQNAVKKFARLYGCYSEWEDIAQTSLLKMLRFADHYDPDRGELLPWACVLIINTIKTQITQSITMPYMVNLDTFTIEYTPTHIDNNPEEFAQASILISMLNDETRMYIEGYTYSEIAARCGFKSKVTAKNHIDNCVGPLCRIMGIRVKQWPKSRRYAKFPG